MEADQRARQFSSSCNSTHLLQSPGQQWHPRMGTKNIYTKGLSVIDFTLSMLAFTTSLGVPAMAIPAFDTAQPSHHQRPMHPP